jgi:hypothetical protein
MLISPVCHGIAAVLPSLPFAKVQYSGHIGGTENKELEREVNDERVGSADFLAMAKEMAKKTCCRRETSLSTSGRTHKKAEVI